MPNIDIERSVPEWNPPAAMRDLVAATNLVGVITQALVSSTGPLLQAVAAQLACQRSIRRADGVVRDHRLVLAKYQSTGFQAVLNG